MFPLSRTSLERCRPVWQHFVGSRAYGDVFLGKRCFHWSCRSYTHGSTTAALHWLVYQPTSSGGFSRCWTLQHASCARRGSTTVWRQFFNNFTGWRWSSGSSTSSLTCLPLLPRSVATLPCERASESVISPWLSATSTLCSHRHCRRSTDPSLSLSPPSATGFHRRRSPGVEQSAINCHISTVTERPKTELIIRFLSRPQTRFAIELSLKIPPHPPHPKTHVNALPCEI